MTTQSGSDQRGVTAQGSSPCPCPCPPPPLSKEIHHLHQQEQVTHKTRRWTQGALPWSPPLRPLSRRVSAAMDYGHVRTGHCSRARAKVPAVCLVFAPLLLPPALVGRAVLSSSVLGLRVARAPGGVGNGGGVGGSGWSPFIRQTSSKGPPNSISAPVVTKTQRCETQETAPFRPQWIGTDHRSTYCTRDASRLTQQCTFFGGSKCTSQSTSSMCMFRGTPLSHSSTTPGKRMRSCALVLGRWAFKAPEYTRGHIHSD